MSISRRFLLRGALGGGAVMVGLPMLDIFLDGNGTALASGAPMPTRFGTWEWGCGMNPDFWTPTKVGADFDIVREIEPLAPHKKDISILSGFNAYLDGESNVSHSTAIWTQRTGTAPKNGSMVDAPSLDVIVGDKIGANTRFRQLDMHAAGSKASYSRRDQATINPSMESPLAVYTRVFGSGFQDPNAGEFKPDPKVMLRKSVLSGVTERRDALLKKVGAADRQRLDGYFSSIRQLENQLALQLQKPAPAEACVVPGKGPDERPAGTDVELVKTNHTLMSDLLVMALACNQTKVFNVVFSSSGSELRTPGSTTNHHMLTHEEPIDEKLGYQPEATFFVLESMKAFAEFVGKLAAVKEGDGRLLDHMLVYAHSDTSFAKIHSLDAMPVILAGSAGGKLKTNMHIAGNGTPVTRTGLTAMMAMGVPLEKWGTRSMETSKPLSELFV